MFSLHKWAFSCLLAGLILFSLIPATYCATTPTSTLRTNSALSGSQDRALIREDWPARWRVTLEVFDGLTSLGRETVLAWAEHRRGAEIQADARFWWQIQPYEPAYATATHVEVVVSDIDGIYAAATGSEALQAEAVSNFGPQAKSYEPALALATHLEGAPSGFAGATAAAPGREAAQRWAVTLDVYDGFNWLGTERIRAWAADQGSAAVQAEARFWRQIQPFDPDYALATHVEVVVSDVDGALAADPEPEALQRWAVTMEVYDGAARLGTERVRLWAADRGRAAVQAETWFWRQIQPFESDYATATEVVITDTDGI